MHYQAVLSTVNSIYYTIVIQFNAMVIIIYHADSMCMASKTSFHKHMHNVSNLSVSNRNDLFNYTCSYGVNSTILFQQQPPTRNSPCIEVPNTITISVSITSTRLQSVGSVVGHDCDQFEFHADSVHRLIVQQF